MSLTIQQLQNSLQAVQDIVNQDLVPAFGDFSQNSTYFNQLISTQTTLSQTLSTLLLSVQSNVLKGDQGIQGIQGLSGATGFGFNQSWFNVTSSRSFNVTYTNTTGKPIFVIVSIGYGSTGDPLLSVDNIPVSADHSSSGTTSLNVFGLVPNGSLYTVSKTTGFTSNFQWSELC